MEILLLILSGLIGGAGLYPYVTATVKGRVRPRLVTWGAWTLLAGVLTISALAQGQTASAALSAQGLIGCAIVVAFGWKHGGKLQFSRLDIFCLIGAAVGIITLLGLRDPTMALITAIVVDAVAFMPTLAHAWTDPEEESLACYVCNVGAAGLALAAGVWVHAGAIGVAYPIYSVTFNIVMVVLLLAGRPSLGDQFDYDGAEA